MPLLKRLPRSSNSSVTSGNRHRDKEYFSIGPFKTKAYPSEDKRKKLSNKMNTTATILIFFHLVRKSHPKTVGYRLLALPIDVPNKEELSKYNARKYIRG
jgi:hypothetical protein